MAKIDFKSRPGVVGGESLDFLQRLRQTSQQSEALLESWLLKTQDAEVRAGLRSQILDVRRQAHMLSDEIKRRGSRVRDDDGIAFGRIFSEIERLDSDLHKLCAFHRGIKAFSLNRSSRLLAHLDPGVSSLVQIIMQEDERHIRWADIRIARLMTHAEMRECNLLMTKYEKTLLILWERSTRSLVHGRHRGDLRAR